MAPPLIVVESEARAVVLRAQMGKEMEVVLLPAAPAKASWRVPKDKLRRVRPRFDFASLPAARPVLDRLHASRDREIYLALANNLQGEYWSWLLSGYLAAVSKGRQVPGRLRPLGLNREELGHSLLRVDTIRAEAAIGCHLRLLLNNSLGKHLDRLLGTRYAPGNLPLDFCTLAIIGLLREREAEIHDHVPPRKWQVRTVFTTGEDSFAARLCYAYGRSEDGYFTQAEKARAASELFRKEAIVVQAVRRTESLLQPPPPYRWPDLVQDALVLHGFSPGQVGRSLEDLGAGVELDGVPMALVSGMWSLVPVACGSLAEKTGEFLAGQGLLAGGDGNETEPEPGSLLPLRPEIEPEQLPAAVSAATRLIYAMIRSRAMASQMAPARIETGEVDFGAGEACRFRAVLRQVLAPGFLEFDQGGQERELLAPSPLDHLQEGNKVALSRVVPEPTYGSPPEQYTLSALVVDLEEYGLAAEPLVVARLDAMIESGYLELLPEGGLRVGEMTAKIGAVLDRALPSLSGLQLPALIAQLAQEMAAGRKPLDFGLHQLEQTLIMRGNVLAKAVRTASRPHRLSSRRIIKATGAGGLPAGDKGQNRPDSRQERAVIPPATHGGARAESPSGHDQEAVTEDRSADAEIREEAEALASEGVGSGPREGEPEAGETPFGTETADDEVLARLAAEAPAEVAEAFLPEKDFPDAGRPCPSCGRPLLIKEDRFGSYLACSGFPACRYAEASRQEEPVMACPLCRHGSIMVKRTAAGRTLYVCREKGCEFLSWGRPHPGACPVCQTPYLVEKKGAGGQVILGCPRAGCGYRQGQGGQKGPDEPAVPRKKVRVRVVKRAGARSIGGKRKVVVVKRRK